MPLKIVSPYFEKGNSNCRMTSMLRQMGFPPRRLFARRSCKKKGKLTKVDNDLVVQSNLGFVITHLLTFYVIHHIGFYKSCSSGSFVIFI